MHGGRRCLIKPYLVASFPDYLACLLTDPKVERLCKQACDDTMSTLNHPPKETTNPFDAKFLQSFEGPIPGQLFIDKGINIRLAFSMNVDFFNPNSLIKCGNHNSIGIISLANLNLPHSI